MKQTNKKNKKNKKGGKVIASGGFGCVFYPAIKCKNNTTRKQNSISKLMTTKYADSEYNEIIKIQQKLNGIPNYEKYFLIYDIDKPCQPDKLIPNDLLKFKEKCSALPKDGITYENINNSLDKLRILNVPYGGLPVDDYINENGSYLNLYNLNISLMNLFKNGIVPMNDRYVYHCDIKDSNILADNSSENLETRLIDWGLSTTYNPYNNDPFPNVWKNRTLQYNVPFSIIIFTDIFINMYNNYLQDNVFNNANSGTKIDKNGKLVFLDDNATDDLFEFLLDYIYIWLEKRGIGHYKLINKIVSIIIDENVNEYADEKKAIKDSKSNTYTIVGDTNTVQFMCHYIIEILVNYTYINQDNTINLTKYLDNVFIYNLDKWGFVSTYLPLLEIFHDNFNSLDSVELQMMHQIKELFVFLYSPSATPIKKEEILTRLNNLNNLFKIEIKNMSNNKRDTTPFLKSINMSKGITGKTFAAKSEQKQKKTNSNQNTKKNR